MSQCSTQVFLGTYYVEGTCWALWRAPRCFGQWSFPRAWTHDPRWERQSIPHPSRSTVLPAHLHPASVCGCALASSFAWEAPWGQEFCLRVLILLAFHFPPAWAITARTQNVLDKCLLNGYMNKIENRKCHKSKHYKSATEIHRKDWLLLSGHTKVGVSVIKEGVVE